MKPACKIPIIFAASIFLAAAGKPPIKTAQAEANAVPAAGLPAVATPASPARDDVVVDAATERLLRGSLKYLAGQQSPAGSWSSRGGQHPVAMTGYTLMAFLACGQLPGEGEYGRNVAAGANYLLSCVRDDGYITSESVRSGRKPSNMYDHGVATMALAEIYGQTQNPEVKKKLEKAVHLIITAQGATGGWRYSPRPTPGDISVTVLQVVALRAAKNASILVPQQTIDRAVAFIKSCYDPPSGGFTYQPHNHSPGFARSAAATYSLQVCGLYDDPLVKSGSKYLFTHTRDREYWTYGNFYAAPAQYMIGGQTWKDWYPKIRNILVPKVIAQGDIAYWKPVEGDGQSLGPVYATAVYTMMLAMPYHYVPLYQR